MVRTKVRYEYIADECARKRTFKKRKSGLLKKASELQTLCGVDTCAIIYESGVSQPDAWPSVHEAHRVVQKFRDLPTMRQNHKMTDGKAVIGKNISMLNGMLEKEKTKNRHLEMERLMIKCVGDGNLQDASSSKDLEDLASLLDESIKLVDEKVDQNKSVE